MATVPDKKRDQTLNMTVRDIPNEHIADLLDIIASLHGQPYKNVWRGRIYNPPYYIKRLKWIVELLEKQYEQVNENEAHLLTLKQREKLEETE